MKSGKRNREMRRNRERREREKRERDEGRKKSSKQCRNYVFSVGSLLLSSPLNCSRTVPMASNSRRRSRTSNCAILRHHRLPSADKRRAKSAAVALAAQIMSHRRSVCRTLAKGRVAKCFFVQRKCQIRRNGVRPVRVSAVPSHLWPIVSALPLLLIRISLPHKLASTEKAAANGISLRGNVPKMQQNTGEREDRKKRGGEGTAEAKQMREVTSGARRAVPRKTRRLR